MDEIVLENISIYAFHGCMKEEARIGSDYIINLKVKADLQHASISDKLEDTINYVDLLKIVNEEMAISSKLLEHVAERIVSRILCTMKMVNNIQVKIAKQNPPINGNISAVTIIRKGSR